MKKRAVLSAIAGFMLAGAMCMSFAACGETDGGGETGEGIGDEAKSIVGEKVDGLTWEEALDLSYDVFDNFELKLEYEASEGMSDKKGSAQIFLTYSYDSRKTYGKSNSEVTASGFTDSELEMMGLELGKKETEYYYDDSGESARYIVKQDGKWVEKSNSSKISGRAAPSESPAPPDNTITTVSIFAPNFQPDAKDTLRSYLGNCPSYDDYEYSEEYKGYIKKESYEESGGGPEGSILTVIKFQDGKFKTFYMVGNMKEGNVPAGEVPIETSMTLSLIISYGGQSVTIPEVSE